jgi:hypothetical protein
MLLLQTLECLPDGEAYDWKHLAGLSAQALRMKAVRGQW